MPPASSLRSGSSAAHPSAELGGVTRYDHVAAVIVSLLVLVGLSVAVLLFIWLGSKLSAHTRTVPVALQKEPTGGSPSGASSDAGT